MIRTPAGDYARYAHTKMMNTYPRGANHTLDEIA